MTSHTRAVLVRIPSCSGVNLQDKKKCCGQFKPSVKIAIVFISDTLVFLSDCHTGVRACEYVCSHILIAIWHILLFLHNFL